MKRVRKLNKWVWSQRVAYHYYSQCHIADAHATHTHTHTHTYTHTHMSCIRTRTCSPPVKQSRTCFLTRQKLHLQVYDPSSICSCYLVTIMFYHVQPYAHDNVSWSSKRCICTCFTYNVQHPPHSHACWFSHFTARLYFTTLQRAAPSIVTCSLVVARARHTTDTTCSTLHSNTVTRAHAAARP